MAVEATGLQSEVVAASQVVGSSLPEVDDGGGAEDEGSEEGSEDAREVVSVAVAVASHGVVGFSVTHSQRAATLERT